MAVNGCAVMKSLVVILLAGLQAASGNIDTDQCPLTRSGNSGCLQCLSSATPEVERCMQLRLLITLTTNHEAETERYCTGNCPIVLATANYYCNAFSDISDLFRECSVYDVAPTGAERFQNCSLLQNSNPNLRQCELCLHDNSQELRRCLQEYLLHLFNTNNTKSRSSFCQSSCPLTLQTSNWYCGVSGNVFEDICTVNENDQLCSDFTVEEIRNDTDYDQCIASNSVCNDNCISAVARYGCCLGRIGLPFNSACTSVPQCERVETGGSPTHLATPLVLAILAALAAIFID